MIDKIREYMSKCPHLNDVFLNVNYLVDKVKAYSINESAGYNPIISKDILGNKEMQFKFNFDVKVYWNEEVRNNIDNSIFFEKVRDWLEKNNKSKIYPEVDGIEPISISATTNGYIYATYADEAIYRISCVFIYMKRR